MSRDPAFEAYSGLCLALPNGRTVTGRLIKWQDGLKLLELLQIYQLTGVQKDFEALRVPFLAVTGLHQDDFDGLEIGEFCDAISAFLSHRRSKPIPSSPSSLAPPPAPTPMPAPTGG